MAEQPNVESEKSRIPSGFALACEIIERKSAEGYCDIMQTIRLYNDLKRPNTITIVMNRARERLVQHEENLRLWGNGFLNPTEPDEQERSCIMRELRAAIAEINHLLNNLE